MIIFPAIDIKNGKCVRLLKGDFDKSTEYEKSPIDQASEFYDLGYKNIHIVDLDGALKGNPINGSFIKEICKIKEIKIQVGGGIRSTDHIKKLIDNHSQFIACSGRLNFELIQKGLMSNIGIMAGVGAPTSLAIDLAKRFEMTLLGFVKNNSFNIYTNKERIII